MISAPIRCRELETGRGRMQNLPCRNGLPMGRRGKEMIPDLRTSPRIADRATGRDNNFNLIRMLAASGVLVSHAWPITRGQGAEQPLQALLQGTSLGTVSVYVFFAISGFFITRSFVLRADLGAFVKARALRLFPALALVVVLTVAVLGPVFTTLPAAEYWRGVPGYALRNLTLFFLDYDLPGVFVANPYGPAINGSLWSLSYEVLCYLGVLACGVPGLLARPRAFAPCLLAFGAFYLAALGLDLHFRLERLAELGLPFVIGMGFWVWRDRVPLSWPLAGILAVAAALAWPTPVFLPVLVLALSHAVFVLGFARIPGLAGYNRLGDYSYGLYVYAFPVQQMMAAGGATDPFVNMLQAAPLTLACAVLSWHLVEAPALRLRQGGRLAPQAVGR